MPKIFEYAGITFYFYSNEHYPIHVHARKNGRECKVEFGTNGNQITSIRILNVLGRKPLKATELKHLRAFAHKYAANICAKWIDYFIFNKDVSFDKIYKKL
jgi:hypothetical protein